MIFAVGIIFKGTWMLSTQQFEVTLFQALIREARQQGSQGVRSSGSRSPADISPLSSENLESWASSVSDAGSAGSDQGSVRGVCKFSKCAEQDHTSESTWYNTRVVFCNHVQTSKSQYKILYYLRLCRSGAKTA
eukprot:1973552-Rhodomonas_salina.3